jgi:hypothetical protein
MAFKNNKNLISSFFDQASQNIAVTDRWMCLERGEDTITLLSFTWCKSTWGRRGLGGGHTWPAWSGHTRSWGSSRSLLHAKFVLTDDLFMIREFKLRVIRQTANARQRKILRYQAIKSKWTCRFKTEIHNYSFDAREKIWNEDVQPKFCQESSNLPFAVPGNVKLKLPTIFINTASRKKWYFAIVPCGSVERIFLAKPKLYGF